MTHDLRLHSGERQTATEYGQIRADHRFRYEWAAARIPQGTFGLDVFCGNGYGTWFLSESRFVLGIDGSSEAIASADQSFRRPTNLFSAAYYPFELPAAAFDFVVALESIEHIRDGEKFFAALCNSLKPSGTLIFSTPCEDHLPHSATGNHFHYKHYTLAETLEIAQTNGMKLVSYSGQDTYQITPEGRQGALLAEDEMQLKAGAPGQFLIVHAAKN